MVLYEYHDAYFVLHRRLHVSEPQSAERSDLNIIFKPKYAQHLLRHRAVEIGCADGARCCNVVLFVVYALFQNYTLTHIVNHAQIFMSSRLCTHSIIVVALLARSLVDAYY